MKSRSNAGVISSKEQNCQYIALAETIQLMEHIDEMIDEHGSWSKT